MSIALFPQQRTSENLIYVILPLAIVLYATVMVYPQIPPEEWYASALFVASFGALFLSMLAPDDIIIRWYYRRLVKTRYSKILSSQFEEHARITEVHTEFNNGQRAAFVDTMVQNAVSSAPIRRRIWRVRVLGYFLLSYPLYIFSGFILLGRLETYLLGSPLETIVILFRDVVAVGVTLFFCSLFFVGFWRRVFTSRLDRDISHVASYLYRRIVEGLVWRRTMPLSSVPASTSPNLLLGLSQSDATRKDLDYLDSLLVRGDLDIFVIMWQNIFQHRGNPPAKPQVYTSLHDSKISGSLLIVLGLITGAFFLYATIEDCFLTFDIARMVLLPVWIFISIVWLFRMCGYAPAQATIYIAGTLAVLSLCPSTIMWLRHFGISVFEVWGISVLVTCQAYLIFATFLVLGIALFKSQLFRPEITKDSQKTARSIPGIVFVLFSIAASISSLIPTLLIWTILGFSMVLSFTILSVVVLFIDYKTRKTHHAADAES